MVWDANGVQRVGRETSSSFLQAGLGGSSPGVRGQGDVWLARRVQASTQLYGQP